MFVLKGGMPDRLHGWNQQQDNDEYGCDPERVPAPPENAIQEGSSEICAIQLGDEVIVTLDHIFPIREARRIWWFPGGDTCQV